MRPNACHLPQAQPPILLFGCQAPGSRPPPPGVCLSRDAGCFAPPLLTSLPSYLGWRVLERKAGTEETAGVTGCQCRGDEMGEERETERRGRGPDTGGGWGIEKEGH